MEQQTTTFFKLLKLSEMVNLITDEHMYLTEKIETMSNSEDFLEIVSYFTKHATAEEEIMRLNNYPDYHKHKDEHGSIIVELTSAKNRRSIQNLKYTITDIVTQHIEKHDKKFLEFLQT